MLCVVFSTALAGGLHALAADLHELQTTLALFFGDVPWTVMDAADAFCTMGRIWPSRCPRRTSYGPKVP